MFIKRPKQKEALNLIGNNTVTLLEGGTRSGKTAIILYALCVRACHYPNTWHLGCRLRRSHIERSIWRQTLPFVLRSLDFSGKIKLTEDDLMVEFNLPDGKSYLIFDGLDDKDRIEKVLGNEYASIFINEASQLSFDHYEMLMGGRLNPPKNIPARLIIDQNPSTKRHWTYKIFHERKFPNGNPVPDGNFAHIKINPIDNKENLSSVLFENLQNLSGNRRQRFLYGEYTSEEGSLWNRNFIKYKSAPETLLRVVIGVDPSGSKDGDEIGIIVAALGSDNKYYILDDFSLHGTPNEWGSEASDSYVRYKADCIAAEKNFGGEMVEAVITDMGRKNINVKMIQASRGKAIRAEPISAMYERGHIFHIKEFTALEDELCTWKQGEKSPNRLDALVMALTEVSENAYNFNYV